MRINPAKRQTFRPVGYVVDPSRIIGEWEGTRWQDVPRTAYLYANQPRDVRPLYASGELEARRWVRGNRRGNGRITGWSWQGPNGPHTITNLRGDLDRIPVESRAQILAEFADYARKLGANVASPASTIGSIIRTSLDVPAYIPRDDSLPDDAANLCRGSRIEGQGGIRVEFGESYLWDIASAFPSALMLMSVPTRGWKHRTMGAHDSIPRLPTGFGKAVVWIPPELKYGPLPDISDQRGYRLQFPTGDILTGVWSFDELRAADILGCRVMLTDVWIGNTYKRPFEPFGTLLGEMKRNLSRAAFRIAKRGSVGAVGAYARNGRQFRSRVINGIEKIWEHGGRCYPQSLGLHALVTSRVRAQLYAEAIAPHADHFVSCHTDGVILTEGEYLIGSGMGTHPGDWGIKREMKRVLLLDAQRYAWEDRDGVMRYSVAGIPNEYVERFFMRKWKGETKIIGERRVALGTIRAVR